MTTTHTDPWQADAACRQYAPDLWHLDEHASAGDVEITAQARAVCVGCPVRKQCLAEAMADRRLSGVWGGTTTVERDRARRLDGDAAAKALREGGTGRPTTRHADDPSWSQPTMRQAHAAWERGERDPHTTEGERRYQQARHLRRVAQRAAS